MIPFRVMFGSAVAAELFILLNKEEVDIPSNLMITAVAAAIVGVLILFDRIGRSWIAGIIQGVIWFASLFFAGMLKRHANSDALAIDCLAIIMIMLIAYAPKRAAPSNRPSGDPTMDETPQSQS